MSNASKKEKTARQIGIIGLGKMGGGIARRLLAKGFSVAGYNRSYSTAEEMAPLGLLPRKTLSDLALHLPSPRILWMMLPSGKATEENIALLLSLLDPGDCLIDGSNSDYKNSLAQAASAEKRGLLYVDAGVSGGIWGAEKGFGLMFGASPEAYSLVLPFMRALAPSETTGWVHTGPPGSGHFAKMAHNAMEYGIMQAYAEGFELLHRKKEFQYNLEEIASAWCQGTVIRSWLLELMAEVLKNPQDIRKTLPSVADSGEARWALREALDLDLPVPVLGASLFERLQSREDEGFRYRLLALLRKAFGGHSTGENLP